MASLSTGKQNKTAHLQIRYSSYYLLIKIIILPPYTTCHIFYRHMWQVKSFLCVAIIVLLAAQSASAAWLVSNDINSGMIILRMFC